MLSCNFEEVVRPEVHSAKTSRKLVRYEVCKFKSRQRRHVFIELSQWATCFSYLFAVAVLASLMSIEWLTQAEAISLDSRLLAPSSQVAARDGAASRHSEPGDSSGWPDVQPTSQQEMRHQQQQQQHGNLLDELLESLPVLSVGQKHAATFECELEKENSVKQLIWLRLNRDHKNGTTGEATNEVALLSLNQKLITPDKRFKVRRQSPVKWTLTLEQVTPDDGHAYYLCQAGADGAATGSGGSGSCSGGQAGGNASPTTDSCHKSSTPGKLRQASRFIGGARLNVLAPPRIIEQDTSPSQVLADEFEPLSLRCKVIGEPQSQLMWKREDGLVLEGVELRFRHEIERRPKQILSIDSSELVFEPHFARHQAGAYHCIASNGVQPGVSQRVNVVAVKCRSSVSADPAASIEPCDQPATTAAPTTSTTTTPTATTDGQGGSTTREAPAARRVWRTGGNQLAGSQAHSPQEQQRSQKHRQSALGSSDKRRTSIVGQRGSSSSSNNNNSDQPVGSIRTQTTSTSGAGASLISPLGLAMVVAPLLHLSALVALGQ